MGVWGVITARGGSRGVPNKNLADLGGRPLLAWTVDAALNSGLDRVILTTDSERIAEVGADLGVEVPFLRPKVLASDEARSLGVVLHAIEHSGGTTQAVMLLQPTSPFRTAGDIDAALELLASTQADSVIGVVEVTQHPEKAMTLERSRLHRTLFSGTEGTPRQELPKYVIPNGAIYLTRTEVIIRHSIFGDHSVGLEMPLSRSINIDSPFDLEVARALVAADDNPAQGVL